MIYCSSDIYINIVREVELEIVLLLLPIEDVYDLFLR